MHYLDNPYGQEGILRPKVTLAETRKRVDLTYLKYRNHYVFSFTGKRNGFGTTYDGEKLGVGLLVVEGGEGAGLMSEYLGLYPQTIYLVIDSVNKYSRIGIIESITDDEVLSSLIKLEVKVSPFSIGFGIGGIQTLFSSYEYRSSLMAGVEMEGFVWKSRVLLGRDPVYSEEYRSLKWEEDASLVFGPFRFNSQHDYRFCDGREEMSTMFSIEWSSWEVGVKANELFVKAKFKDCSFSISPSSSSFSLLLEGGKGDLNWSVRLVYGKECVLGISFEL